MKKATKDLTIHENMLYKRIIQRLIDLEGDNRGYMARLERKTGIRRDIFCRWFNGQSRPSLLSLIKVSKSYNISLDELIN